MGGLLADEVAGVSLIPMADIAFVEKRWKTKQMTFKMRNETIQEAVVFSFSLFDGFSQRETLYPQKNGSTPCGNWTEFQPPRVLYSPPSVPKHSGSGVVSCTNMCIQAHACW